jgi:hypothetical protein
VVTGGSVAAPGLTVDQSAWPARALFTAGSRRLALLVMIASVFFPVSGLGVDLCPLHAATGLPCPGCGMSRAIAAVSQGDFSAALGLNPFVLFAWPLFLGLALLAFAPGQLVRATERWIDRHQAGISHGYKLVLFAFLGFGVVRFLVMFALRERFP